jgi:hypothetical protein
MAIKLIEEATKAGACESLVCKKMGISQRTLQRWRGSATPLQDQRPVAKRPRPKTNWGKKKDKESWVPLTQRNFKVSLQAK